MSLQAPSLTLGGGGRLPVVFVLDDPLVPLQLVFQRRLVHGQVATLAGEPLQGPLGLLDLLPQGLDFLVVHLNLVVVGLLCVFDVLLQHRGLRGKITDRTGMTSLSPQRSLVSKLTKTER